MEHARTPLLISALKQCLGPAYPRLREAELWLEYKLRRPQPDSEIAREAQAFWTAQDANLKGYSHWRGVGFVGEEDRWLSLGKEHVRLYEQLVRIVGRERPLRRVVDWGCGGGANAVHFAPMAEEYVGVEVAEANLTECGRQLSRLGLSNFVPVLIDSSRPEEALSLVPGPVDLFLCVYVFQVLPTPEYGLRILKVAHDLLAESGLAIIQIKYVTDTWGSKPKRFSYRRNMAFMTSYRIEDFWSEAERIGFIPRAVTLVPHQPLNADAHYAYFLMEKPGSALRRALEARR